MSAEPEMMEVQVIREIVRATTDWLRDRQRGLCGSDLGQIPSIVRAVGGTDADIPTEGGEWSVWASKRGEPEVRPITDIMATEHRLKSAIGTWATADLGRAWIPWVQGSIEVAGTPIRVTPDGYTDANYGRTLIACKVAGDRYGAWGVPPPLRHRIQVHAERLAMRSSGMDVRRAVLAVYHRLPSVWKRYDIDEDEYFDRALVDAARTW